jgi:hypothetical protein
MFCKNCGEYIRGNGSYCERCKEMLVYSNGLNVDEEIVNEIYAKNDKSGVLLVLVSFVLPFLGVILYFLNKSHLPKKAQVIMGSTLMGCVAWCSLLLFFNTTYIMNVDVICYFEEMFLGYI